MQIWEKIIFSKIFQNFEIFYQNFQNFELRIFFIKYKIFHFNLNAQIQNFVKIHLKLQIFYFIGSFLEGQNCVEKNRGLLNKVAGTNQLDFVKTKNVLPGASLINCGNHFSWGISSILMPPGGWCERRRSLHEKANNTPNTSRSWGR